MRKAISIVLAIILVSSSVVPAAAQKGRQVGPAKRIGVVESTRFATIAAYTDGQHTFISWQMAAEIGNIGFYVYRVGKSGVELLSPAKMVAGAATHAREVPAYGESYSFVDRDGGGDAAYYVEALSLNGSKIATDRVYPQYVSDLRAVSGMSSEDLAARAANEPAQLERSILTLTKELANEISESELTPDPTAHRTVISTTGAVRIGVKTEGLYRVTRAQLEAAGFNVNGDSSLWQLYVEGVEQAMIIGNNADYIEFYGKGTDTRETDTRAYFLITGATAGKRMETRVATRNTSTVVTPSYLQTFVKKERNNYVEDINNGPSENYFGRGIGATQTTMTFNLSGVDFGSPTSGLHLRFQGYSLGGTHLIEVILNDHVLDPAFGDAGEVSFTKDYSIPTSFLLEGANNIKFRAIGPASDFCYFDTMNIGFSRKFVADQNKVSFYTVNYRAAQLTGFTSANVRVFDMTTDGSPVLMSNLDFQENGGSFGVSLPASRGRSFFAVEDSAILAPLTVTANNPELLTVPTNDADLVIISYKDFMPQAEAWATYRRGPGQGFAVKVIEVSELYDELNFGTFSSDSIRSFLQYAKTNWQNGGPDYVLLIGDGSVDSRNYENQGSWNMVPPMIVPATYSETASDDALADFDNDGLSEMAIGRIASRTSAGVTTVFNKTVHWETQLPIPQIDRGALFAYDHNDQFYNFEVMSTNIANQLPMTVPKTLVYRGQPAANATLLFEMNAGKYLVNFAGHGTTGSWGGNPVFFNIFSVPTLTENPNSPAVYTMLTCLNGAFHYLFNESFAEVLTKSPNRGAVAAWASTGKTTGDVQERMAVRFYLKAGEGNIPRLGDLIKDAKSVLFNDGTDVRLSWALIGDPMLKVR